MKCICDRLKELKKFVFNVKDVKMMKVLYCNTPV